MIKAVLFDLDGVIVSTDDLHFKAWKQMAIQEQIHFDETINNQLRGISRMESLEIILKATDKKYSLKEKEQLANFKNNFYVESLQTLTKDAILPNVMNVLETLKENGIKVAIGSSSKNAKLILKQIGLNNYFDAVSDGTNITKSKPDPEVFIKAADMLQTPYQNCAVVEDAVSGLQAAKACGMITFATGDAEKSTLKDYLFKDILNIIQF